MVRTTPVIVLLGLFAVAPGCRHERRTVAEDNLLVLDLGGDHPSLQADLQRTAPRPAPAPEPEVLVPPGPGPDTPPEPRPEPQPRPEPRPKPQPDAAFHVVTLAEGQTLYGLCRQHLGDGGRWKEVARINGWSEARAGRLKAGQRVKLPVR